MTGKELRDGREQEGKSQGELAKELGIGERTIRRWEATDAAIPGHIVEKLAGGRSEDWDGSEPATLEKAATKAAIPAIPAIDPVMAGLIDKVIEQERRLDEFEIRLRELEEGRELKQERRSYSQQGSMQRGNFSGLAFPKPSANQPLKRKVNEFDQTSEWDPAAESQEWRGRARRR